MASCCLAFRYLDSEVAKKKLRNARLYTFLTIYSKFLHISLLVYKYPNNNNPYKHFFIFNSLNRRANKLGASVFCIVHLLTLLYN